MLYRFGRFWRVQRSLSRLYSFTLKYSYPSRVFTAFVIEPPKIKTVNFGGYTIKCNIPGVYINGLLINSPSQNNEMPSVRYFGEDLKDGDVFYEIGSAWGYYALLANKMAKLKQVVALEPQSLNYAETMRNVYLNNFRNTFVFPVAAGDEDKWDDLYLQAFQMGYGGGRTMDYERSDTELGVRETEVILQKKAFTPRDAAGRVDQKASDEPDPTEFAPNQDLPMFEWVERIHFMPLDKLIRDNNLHWPTHFLMDIDGGEVIALKGMEETLKHPDLRGASIEVDSKTEPEVNAIMSRHGFVKHVDKRQRRGNIVYVRKG